MKPNAVAVAADDEPKREPTPRELATLATEAHAAAIDKAAGLKARVAELEEEQTRIASDRRSLNLKLAAGDYNVHGSIDALERREKELAREIEGVNTLLQDATAEVDRCDAELRAAVQKAQIAHVHESLERERAAAQRLIPAFRDAIAKAGELFGAFSNACDHLDGLVAQLESKQPFNEWRQLLMNELNIGYPNAVCQRLLTAGWRQKVGGWGGNGTWVVAIVPLYAPPAAGNKGEAE